MMLPPFQLTVGSNNPNEPPSTIYINAEFIRELNDLRSIRTFHRELTESRQLINRLEREIEVLKAEVNFLKNQRN